MVGIKMEVLLISTNTNKSKDGETKPFDFTIQTQNGLISFGDD